MTSHTSPRAHAATATRLPALTSWRQAIRRWSQRARATTLLHSRAVILDVETTDLHGRICEIAIVDMRGHVLLETLINPQAPITPGAAAVHGITDAQVSAAPTWADIAPTVAEILATRTVIAYNAPFDQSQIRQEMRRIGASTLPVEGTWWCLMRARAAVENRSWQALEGGHRAAGDCRAALEVLTTIALPLGRR